MNEKELFAFMIKHYQTVDYELHKKKSQEINITDDSIENTSFYLPFRKEENGIRYINFPPSSYSGNHGYCQFYFTREAKIDEITKKGIVLYHEDSGEYICLIKDILEVLSMESEHMYNLILYRGSNDDRLPSNYLAYYFNSIRCHLEKIKNKSVSSAIYFIDEQKGIEKHGVFAYCHLYDDINWTFELVEKYKNQIVGWRLLIERGNLFWSEEKIEFYYGYIVNDRHGNSVSVSQKKFPIKKFNNIACLSWDFLLKHYDDIDFYSYIESGNINYDAEIISILYYELGEDKLFWDKLLQNPTCVWTIELFELIYRTNEGRASLLQMDEERRLSIYEFIRNNCNAYLFDSEYLRVLREGKLQYGYSEDFNIENVKKNTELWNEVVFDTFRPNIRSNVYKGAIKTIWNYFTDNKFVTLTYELCKYLLETEIIMGDFSEKEYSDHQGCWHEYGKYSYKINGLKVFRGKHIKNESELKKIFADEELLSAMFSYEYFNQDVVDYTINKFFSNFSIESWHEIIDFITSRNTQNYVDLGLSVYWATQNLGANSPLEYGEKFIWGEPYSDIDIDEAMRYKQAWIEDMSQVTNKNRGSKYYGAVDIAKTRFDAAYMNLGGNWRMPRINEFQELIDKCTWEEANINNIRVYKITGTNGNYILLPYLPFRNQYLTSMRHSSYPCIYVLLKGSLSSDEVDRLQCATIESYIRPVFEKDK